MTLGGIITDTVGWRWAFLVNLPAGLAFASLLLGRARPRAS